MTACATVCIHLGWIRKDRKLADFEQKAWAIAHGFEHCRFSELLEIASNSLKRLQNRSKMISDCLCDCLCRFRVNSQGSKIGQFWAKALGYSPWFWTCRFWQVLEIAPNSPKRLQNRSKMICDCLCDVCVDLGWIRKGRQLANFEQKAWAIAHGFEHGRFWQVLEIALNSLKRLQNRSKMIFDCFRDCLCRFRGNSRGSKIDRFWAKGLGYSPWFWTLPIFWTPGNCSKLCKTPPKPF